MNAQEELQRIVSSPTFHTLEIPCIEIDGIMCWLGIYKSETGEFTMELGSVSKIVGDSFLWNIKDPNELTERLVELSRSKWIRHELMNENELSQYLRARYCVYQLLGKHPNICYVCQEDAHDFTTECLHSICIKCYEKSIQVSNNHSQVFQCGVCRKKITHYQQQSQVEQQH